MSEVDQMPGHLIRRFQQIAVAIFHAEVAKTGIDLTPVQYAAMAKIAEIDGVDQATLAGLIAYDRATITGVADRLVQKGYIERVVSPRDRRARELHLTDQGREIFAKVSPAVQQAQQSMLAGLDGEEQSELLRLMAKAITAGNEQSRAPLKRNN